MHQNHIFTYYHKSQFKKEVVKIPNILSILRIIIALLIPVFLFWKVNEKVIFYLIILGALSDTLEGNLARLLKQKTRLGKLIDPLADKLFINTLFFFFYLKNKIPLYLLILSLTRDIFIIIGGIYLLRKKVSLSKINPSILGKASTVCEFIFFILIFLDFYFFKISTLVKIFTFLTAFLIITSGLHYFYVFFRLVKYLKTAKIDGIVKSSRY